ncbi:xaa-Pro aminopeptidase 3-like [Drosophila miranda]|uniref:xaa-Pro aminopeptidase 3 n=1 Tax=Drosophila miranda TaxID=7229 RepID=UPI0007E6C0FE|nr:xaa-Pro aminopeptidase 3 [Drosophila miranda]XP_033247511.1 xaa-Pro aminopeptidase 3-like [Drosophila miranda]
MIALKNLARFVPMRGRSLAEISTFLQPQRCNSQASSTKDNTTTNGTSGLVNLLNKLDGPRLGQPTCVSHPHLILPHELVPGLTLAEFQQRRIALMQKIQSYASTFGDNYNGRSTKNHMLIVGAASKKYMSGKIPYVFRQNSDFYYLTGCLEPDSVLVMTIDQGSNVESMLFLRPKDAHAELWDGPRTGPELSVPLFGVTEAHSLSQFETILGKLVTGLKPHFWFDLKSCDLQHVKEGVIKTGSTENIQLLPVHTFLEAMRLLKSPAEMDLMRRTCQIAAQSINEVMAETRPGQSEHHLFASVDFKCRQRNASFLAYPPVVAAGRNATIIHYVDNSQLLQPQDLVLMDAGCEYGGYTSDITRTWPASGTFTDPQRTLYEMVSTLQSDIVGMIGSIGGETLDQLFQSTCYRLGKYLQEIGLVSRASDDYKTVVSQGYRFCPHHVSHYLGMDVHDTPNIPRSKALEPGMVFTVEPGVYIGEECTDVPAEFRGIGIRIEDDLLISQDGVVEVLTAECIKDRQRLEHLCQQVSVETDSVSASASDSA